MHIISNKYIDIGHVPTWALMSLLTCNRKEKYEKNISTTKRYEKVCNCTEKILVKYQKPTGKVSQLYWESLGKTPIGKVIGKYWERKGKVLWKYLKSNRKVLKSTQKIFKDSMKVQLKTEKAHVTLPPLPHYICGNTPWSTNITGNSRKHTLIHTQTNNCEYSYIHAVL